MGYKIVKTTAEEAHALAGHPYMKSSIGTALAVSTASGVGTYQINRKLAHVQGDVVPPLSATSGSSPGISAQDAIGATHRVTNKITKRKGGKNAH